MDPEDRRATVRFRRRHPLAYRAQTGESGEALTWDISPSGLHVVSSEPPPAGATIQLEVSVGERRAQLRGVVSWSRAPEPDKGRHGGGGFGVRLTWIPEEWPQMCEELASNSWRSE
jgi:hypothetical protein